MWGVDPNVVDAEVEQVPVEGSAELGGALTRCFGHAGPSCQAVGRVPAYPFQGGSAASECRSSLASRIHYVLAAPGAGKSAVAPHYARFFPDRSF